MINSYTPNKNLILSIFVSLILLLNENCYPISLTEAAEAGDLMMIQRLIRGGADLNKKENSYAPLYRAAQYGHLKAVVLLLKNGAKVDITNKDDFTPLFVAAERGHFKIVELLIGIGANVNFKRPDGTTCLHFAAAKARHKIVRLLTRKGADLSAITKEVFTFGGQTPLHYAASAGDIQSVRFFLENGADVNSKSFGGWTPLQYAAANGHTELAEILLQKGAGKNIYIAASMGDVEEIKRLISSETDVNQRARAIQKYNKLYELDQVLKYIERRVIYEGLKRDGDLDKFDLAPLHFAALNNQKAAAALLIEKGADLNITDKHGNTPLHLAAQNGAVASASLLIEKGAKMETRNKENRTSRDLAEKYGHQHIVELLKKHGDTTNTIKTIRKAPELIKLANQVCFLEVSPLTCDLKPPVPFDGKPVKGQIAITGFPYPVQQIRLWLFVHGASPQVTEIPAARITKQEQTLLINFGNELRSGHRNWAGPSFNVDVAVELVDENDKSYVLYSKKHKVTCSY